MTQLRRRKQRARALVSYRSAAAPPRGRIRDKAKGHGS
jgi:hypothetical protein